MSGICSGDEFTCTLDLSGSIAPFFISHPIMNYHGPRENGEGRVSEGGHDRARDPTITNIPNVSIPTPLRLAWGLSTPNTAAEPEATTTDSPSILDLSLTTRTPYFRCIYGTISSHASTAYYSSRHTWSTT